MFCVLCNALVRVDPRHGNGKVVSDACASDCGPEHQCSCQGQVVVLCLPFLDRIEEGNDPKCWNPL